MHHLTRTALCLAFCTCTAAVVADEQEVRDLSTFTEISLHCPAAVTLVQDGDHQIEIQADEDVIDRIETNVDGDRLVITLEDRWFNWGDRDDNIKLRISFADLTAVNVHGSSDVEGESLALETFAANIKGSGSITLDEVSAETLSISISGTGDVEIDSLDTDSVVTVIRGSGNVELAGHANDLEATIQGSGDLTTDDLKTEVVSVVINGSGDARVHADATLDAIVRGSGDIRYEGTAEVTQQIYGSGDVTEM